MPGSRSRSPKKKRRRRDEAEDLQRLNTDTKQAFIKSAAAAHDHVEMEHASKQERAERMARVSRALSDVRHLGLKHDTDHASFPTIVLDAQKVKIAAKMTRRVGRFPILCGFCAMPAMGFILVFSAMGYGYEIHDQLIGYSVYADYCLSTACIILFLLYVLDSASWQRKYRILAKLLWYLTLVMIFAGSALKVDDYPPAPMAVCLLLLPAFLGLLRRPLMIDAGEYMLELSYPLFLVGIGSFVVWGMWVLGFLDMIHITRSPEDMDWCDIPNEERAEKGVLNVVDVLGKCDSAFIVWFAPALLGAAYLSLAAFCYVLSADFRQMHMASKNKEEKEKELGRARIVTAASFFLTVAVAAFYTSASMSSLNMYLCDLIITLSLALVVFILACLGALLDTNGFRKEFLNIPIVRATARSMLGEHFRAFVALFIAPMGLVYTGAYRFNIWLRKTLKCGSNDNSDESEGADKDRRPSQLKKTRKVRRSSLDVITGVYGDFTEDIEDDMAQTMSATFSIMGVYHWPWTSIIDKAMLLGVVIIMCQVGLGKLVTLFLAWLNAFLASFSLMMVIVIFFIAGFLLFATPLPGAPMYVLGGVVITSAGQKVLGFWPSMFLATFVSLVVKLSAVVFQQKVIGEALGSFVWVRKMVGVNSLTIRAIEKILQRSGFSIGKILILCGGPDWPTSVLTGILHLPLGQMLIGTLPVWFSITPVSFSSGLLLKAHEGPTWVAVGNTMLMAASFVQGGAFLGAAICIQRTVKQYRGELKAKEDDEEVKRLEKIDEIRQANYEKVTDWHNVEGPHKFPFIMKLVCFVGLMLMSTAMYIFLLLPNHCFRTFTINDSIAEKLDGRMSNIVKREGWIAIACFIAACLCNLIFRVWANGRARLYVPSVVEHASKNRQAQKPKRASPRRSSTEGQAKQSPQRRSPRSVTKKEQIHRTVV